MRSRRLTADRRVRFGRWLGNPRRAVAALETERRVTWKFVDLTGRPIDVHLVQRLVLRSITGEVTTYTGDQLKQPHWLLAQRVVPLTGGLQTKDLYYSVQAIDVLRSNVVNASQQRFVPTATAAADVPAVVLSAGTAGRGRAVRPARPAARRRSSSPTGTSSRCRSTTA